MTQTFDITGMHCAACSSAVARAITAVDGVENADVNLLLNTATVKGNANAATIIDAVKKAGYAAAISSNALPHSSPAPSKSSASPKKVPSLNGRALAVARLAMSAALLVPLTYLNMTRAMILVQFALATLVLVLNRRFFVSAAVAIVHRSLNMDTLIALGSATSYIWSVYALVKMRLLGTTAPIYFESAAMILTFISIGKLLEDISKGRTTNALRALTDLCPKVVTIIKNGNPKEIPLGELCCGDVFITKVGDAVATDAIIIEGNASFDESMLTGESDLIKKTEGVQVTGGTILKNVDGDNQILCQAEKVGGDTVLQKIIKSVAEASSTKAPITRVADKVASVFVPAVILIAIVTFAAWKLLGAETSLALQYAISTLVISCPCALGLATPCAVMVSSGLAAKNGILFKNASSIETLSKVDVIAFDKTGTITKGVVGSDTIKEESPQVIKNLHDAGVKTVMISGDKETEAKKIAQLVGVSKYYSKVLPDGKAAIVKELQQASSKKAGNSQIVAMVGDGVNDSVALTTADVGLAISTGKDVAIESSDVVILSPSLLAVNLALKISKAAMRVIKQNLFWALFYNMICIPMAAGAFVQFGVSVTPGISALCMGMSSVCVVCNALRLNGVH